MINKNIFNWLNNQKKKQFLTTKKIDLSKLNKWIYSKREIYHKSKKFFRIAGIRIQSNFYNKKNWDQPIIVQNEIGILGIIKNKKTNKYLLQAKVEPGNINKIQISPTVQATRSNYSRIHGGKNIPFLEYFKRKIKISHFKLSKLLDTITKNSNIVAYVNKKIDIDENLDGFLKLKFLTY